MNNMEDIIDSRDIIERINLLESLNADDEISEDEEHELSVLRDLNSQGDDYIADWQYGIPLIRWNYFATYTQELAYDTGAISDTATWPHNCIDWERAAEELKWDYTSLEFDGVVYYAI
jgi:hypothetical protein